MSMQMKWRDAVAKDMRTMGVPLNNDHRVVNTSPTSAIVGEPCGVQDGVDMYRVVAFIEMREVNGRMVSVTHDVRSECD